MTQAQPLIQTLPMTLGAPMSDDPSNPTAIEIPLQIELPNGQTLFAAVALGGLPFDGQRQIAERIAAAWNAFTGVTTEEIKAPVKCLHQIAEPAAVHPDDVAVDALAALMKAKLAKQRGKGYSGWDTDCTQEHLSNLLRTHVNKGDPVDVANFCAFLAARGEMICLTDAELINAMETRRAAEPQRLLAVTQPAPQAVQPAVAVEVDLPDVEDMAHSAVQEALSYGVNHDVFHRWMRAVMDKTVKALSAPMHPAEGVPAQAVQPITGPCGQCKDSRTPCACALSAILKERGWEAVDAAHYEKISQRAKSATQPAAQGMDADSAIRHLAIGRAIERVCVELPDGAEISISLEKGAGTITLIDWDGNEQENFPTDDGFAGTLNAALDTAIADEAAQQPQEPACGKQ